MTAIYDELAIIYDAWANADPASSATIKFYKKLAQKEQGIITELGVGTGRIALELAACKKNIIGIDLSKNMLDVCRHKAKKNGLVDKVHLIKNDIRHFDLPEPADLIYLPFRTVGHMLTKNDRLELFNSVYKNLNVGGKFVFDHYMFSKKWARDNERKKRLMCIIPCKNHNSIYVYDIYLYDYDRQLMDCRIIIEDIDKRGNVIRKRYVQFTFSWITISQIKKIIHQSGFELDDLLGSFDGDKWTEKSENQVWILRKNKQ